jgi:hypothetical protein
MFAAARSPEPDDKAYEIYVCQAGMCSHQLQKTKTPQEYAVKDPSKISRTDEQKFKT